MKSNPYHRLKTVRAVFAVAICGILVNCNAKQDRVVIALTLVIDTPNGMKNNTGLVELKAVEKSLIALPDMPDVSFTLLGEAPVIRFDSRRYLAATFKSPSDDITPLELIKSPYNILASRKFGSEWRAGQNLVDDIAFVKSIPERLPVPREKWPLLVYFPDISRPYLGRIIDPDELNQKLPGHKLIGLYVQVTSRRVVYPFSDILKWGRNPGSGNIGCKQPCQSRESITGHSIVLSDIVIK